MKKSIIISIIIALLISIGSFTTIAIQNTNAKSKAQNQATAIVLDDSSNFNTTLPKLNSSDETVYIITKASGETTKSFIGSTLNTNSEPLPVNYSINYYLDHEPVIAEDLSGQSGHIQITYQYTPIKTHQNKYVPFAAITILTLNDNYSNLSLKNGKIISSGNKTIVLGYSFVGLNENFGTDFLPSTFEFEADVTDFKLDSTYTLLTNDLFANLDTTKLTSIDALINSINDLSAGMNQLISGATSLESGLGELSSGLSTLRSQVSNISSRILEVTNEAEASVNALDTQVASSIASLEQLPTSPTAITSAITNFATEHNLNPDFTANLINLVNENYAQMLSPINEQKDSAIATIQNGINTAKSYISEIKNNTIELQNGVDALADGASKLHAGSTKLKNGLITFKTQGINRLVNFANHDLDNFVMNLRKTVEAASSYSHYSDSNSKSVKFIYKTPSI